MGTLINACHLKAPQFDQNYQNAPKFQNSANDLVCQF